MSRRTLATVAPITLRCNHLHCGPRRMRPAGPSQGSNRARAGGSAAVQPQAWGDHTGRARASIGTRLATFVIAALALLLILYGQHWMLQRSPASPDELTVATCIVGAVANDPVPDHTCTSSVVHDDKEML